MMPSHLRCSVVLLEGRSRSPMQNKDGWRVSHRTKVKPMDLLGTAHSVGGVRSNLFKSRFHQLRGRDRTPPQKPAALAREAEERRLLPSSHVSSVISLTPTWQLSGSSASFTCSLLHSIHPRGPSFPPLFWAPSSQVGRGGRFRQAHPPPPPADLRLDH